MGRGRGVTKYSLTIFIIQNCVLRYKIDTIRTKFNSEIVESNLPSRFANIRKYFITFFSLFKFNLLWNSDLIDFLCKLEGRVLILKWHMILLTWKYLLNISRNMYGDEKFKLSESSKKLNIRMKFRNLNDHSTYRIGGGIWWQICFQKWFKATVVHLISLLIETSSIY